MGRNRCNGVQGQLPLQDAPRRNGTVPCASELAFHSSDTGSVSLASLQLPAGMQVQCDVAIGTIQYDGWQLAAASLALEGNGNGWVVPRFRAETLDGLLSGDGSLTFHSEGQRAKLMLHPTAASCDLPGLFEAFDNFDQATLRAAFDRSLRRLRSRCNWTSMTRSIGSPKASMCWLCHHSLR